MDRLPSSSVPVHRAEQPQLLELPEEALVAIISTIDKADNATLSHLAQTCKDLWRIASVDTLRSFFYAAHQAYETGDASKKVVVFSVLSDWIGNVADQLPEATRWQMLGHLSHMATIDGLADPALSMVMAAATERLAKLSRQELASEGNRLQARLDAAADKQGVQVSDDMREWISSTERLVNAFERHTDSYVTALNALRFMRDNASNTPLLLRTQRQLWRPGDNT